MENIFYLNENDVLSVDKDSNGWVVVTDTTFKVSAFLAKVTRRWKS